MKIVEINLGNYGSTGKIMYGIGELCENNGHKVLYAYPSCKTQKENDYIICSRFMHRLFEKASFFTGRDGLFAYFETKRFLIKINKFHPDAIHFHNLHSNYINLQILFKYIKKYKVKTIWTLHDCWAFTGHCSHFTMVKCGKWKIGCNKCPQYKEYPKSYFDNSKKMYKLKQKWFMGIENMTIVTPSQWLADLVKQSFLKDYPVKVINNGIDLSIFKPTESNFRQKYNIAEDKFILLGVAFGWGRRKGLDVFIELSKRLSDKYQIVLVGTDDNVDKQLPGNIISIHRTQNQTELAEIYSAADLFANPTREENYPTVNMESLACGTPVLTFRTGGSPEIIDETCGIVVECDDIDALENEIKRICTKKPYSKDACLARAKSFDMNERFQEYIELYEQL